MSGERRAEFQQAVERSISDACRVVGRDPNPYVNAKALWESGYKDELPESVLDEYKDREPIVPGEYTPFKK